MDPEQRYSLQEIETYLKNNNFPFCGITELGSAQFKFLRPAYYAGTAIHAGNKIRDDLRDIFEVSPADQYREEDPGTEKFIKDLPIQIIGLDSRFEYDLNRPRKIAIYLSPEMAWGLTVWKRPLTQNEINVSLSKHNEFYRLMDLVVDYLLRQNKRAFIFDLHSYCYQREERLPWTVDTKPVVNLGTKSINQSVFGKDINHFLDQLEKISINGYSIPVAENEIFKGGYMARRLCARSRDKLAVFAIEFKKIFMDEWSGEFFPAVFDDLVEKFSLAIQKFIDELSSNAV